MIGLVVVSHSAKVAEGVCDLAGQVAAGKVRLAAAGGASDPNYPIGTDACRVAEAIESVFSTDGVLVFMDMGSAVLAAGLALDFLDESPPAARTPVRRAPGGGRGGRRHTGRRGRGNRGDRARSRARDGRKGGAGDPDRRG